VTSQFNGGKEITNNSVALVSVRIIPTGQLSLVGEDSANFFADRKVSRCERGGSPTAVISISRLEPLLFLPSSSSVVPTRLSGPRSRPTTAQKIW
jgi:hypothetical protein